jgi:predicted nucleic acid-binding protein
VTRYLLDTNIVSNMIKPAPSQTLAAWLLDQRYSDLFIASWTMAEIRRGILTLPDGRRRDGLDEWFHGAGGPVHMFAGRILPFDEAAAEIWARLVAQGYRTGRPRSETDMIIAATALAHDCMIVTHNTRDFDGVAPVLNPMA